jgi:hypothetical protein
MDAGLISLQPLKEWWVSIIIIWIVFSKRYLSPALVEGIFKVFELREGRLFFYFLN